MKRVFLIIVGILFLATLFILSKSMIITKKTTVNSLSQNEVNNESVQEKPNNLSKEITSVEISSTNDNGIRYEIDKELSVVAPDKMRQEEEIEELNKFEGIKPLEERQKTFKPIQKDRPIYQPIVKITSEPVKPAQTNLEKNILTCKPYNEKMSAEYLGMLVDYELYIRGWIEDKCVIDFISKVKGAAPSFNETYNTDIQNVQVYSFAPIFKCQFSKEQLDYVGDSVLQENERDSGNVKNMLKNPNTIELPQMDKLSPYDMRLLEVILRDKACKLQNEDDLSKMINELLN